MISVVIPLYNKATTIRRCLLSVFSQTISPSELIVINDGSQDESLEIVKQTILLTSTVSVKIVNQKNSGVSYSRNKGVSLAKNKFVAFLDADDEWHVDFIETAQKVISRYHDISLFTCKHKIMDDSIGCFTPKQVFGENETGLIENYFEKAKSYPLINSSKVVVNKSYFLKVGGFPEKAKVSEDLFLWIKLSKCAPIVYSNRLLVTIFQAPDNSRGSRIGEVPYPIVHYSVSPVETRKDKSLYFLLWSIHFKHVLGSCTSNKNEALIRILYGLKLFRLRGGLLLPLLIVPKSIFNYIRMKKRKLMVIDNA